MKPIEPGNENSDFKKNDEIPEYKKQISAIYLVNPYLEALLARLSEAEIISRLIGPSSSADGA